MRVSTRLPFPLHRQAALDADARGMAMNDWLVWAAQTALNTPRTADTTQKPQGGTSARPR